MHWVITTVATPPGVIAVMTRTAKISGPKQIISFLFSMPNCPQHSLSPLEERLFVRLMSRFPWYIMPRTLSLEKTTPPLTKQSSPPSHNRNQYQCSPFLVHTKTQIERASQGICWSKEAEVDYCSGEHELYPLRLENTEPIRKLVGATPPYLTKLMIHPNAIANRMQLLSKSQVDKDFNKEMKNVWNFKEIIPNPMKNSVVLSPKL